jgi:hypothetical protein
MKTINLFRSDAAHVEPNSIAALRQIYTGTKQKPPKEPGDE